MVIQVKHFQVPALSTWLPLTKDSGMADSPASQSTMSYPRFLPDIADHKHAKGGACIHPVHVFQGQHRQ